MHSLIHSNLCTVNSTMDPVKDTQRDTLLLENRFFILKKINSYSGAKSIGGMMDVILDLFSCRKTYGTMLIVNTE